MTKSGLTFCVWSGTVSRQQHIFKKMSLTITAIVNKALKT